MHLFPHLLTHPSFFSCTLIPLLGSQLEVQVSHRLTVGAHHFTKYPPSQLDQTLQSCFKEPCCSLMFPRFPFYVLKPAAKLMATKPVGFGFDQGEAAHNLFLLKFSFGHRCHYISSQKLLSTSVSSRLDYYKSLFCRPLDTLLFELASLPPPPIHLYSLPLTSRLLLFFLYLETNKFPN